MAVLNRAARVVLQGAPGSTNGGVESFGLRRRERDTRATGTLGGQALHPRHLQEWRRHPQEGRAHPARQPASLQAGRQATRPDKQREAGRVDGWQTCCRAGCPASEPGCPAAKLPRKLTPWTSASGIQHSAQPASQPVSQPAVGKALPSRGVVLRHGRGCPAALVRRHSEHPCHQLEVLSCRSFVTPLSRNSRLPARMYALRLFSVLTSCL